MLIGQEPPPAAAELSARVRAAWIAFATTGDPGWPAYEPQNGTPGSSTPSRPYGVSGGDLPRVVGRACLRARRARRRARSHREDGTRSAHSSVAVDGAGIREQAAGGVPHELVVRTVRVEHELQHAVGVVVVHDAVRLDREEAGEERAAGTRDDLGDAIGRVDGRPGSCGAKRRIRACDRSRRGPCARRTCPESAGRCRSPRSSTTTTWGDASHELALAGGVGVASSLCSQRSCSLPATQLLLLVPHSVFSVMMRQFPIE